MTTVDAYLERIGAEQPDVLDLGALARLQHAHLVAVPFENLDVFHRVQVSVDQDVVLAKIVGGRGGWCFENNGAFAWLLEQLGFRVMRIGAAVQGRRPRHGDRPPHDRGSTRDGVPGRRRVRRLRPLDLNRAGPQNGGGSVRILASPQGNLAEHEDGVPVAKFRFKQVAHELTDFAKRPNASPTMPRRTGGAGRSPPDSSAMAQTV